MSLELTYNLRHLQTHRATSLMTIAGIALVVAVYVATLMLAQGLRKTLAGTGSYENAIVLRSGARNEIQSGITRESANIILASPEAQRREDGTAIATTDTVVLVSLKKRADGEPSNVTVRGVNREGLAVRSGVTLLRGRLPSPGTKEVMVGSPVSMKFAGTGVGESIRLVGTDWPVVGIFDAGRSGFSSEIWGDVEVLMPSFKREQFSSITLKLKSGANFEALTQRLENDRRLTVEVQRETEFYEDQSRSLGTFIRIMGTFISVIFSIGAIVGAMITMYSSVANRTREIGILRAIGFSKGSILRAFVQESLLIALIGGITGITFASLLTFASISTTNFDTFADLSFGFSITPGIVLNGLIFSLIMGVLGGALPAYRASRTHILTALRS